MSRILIIEDEEKISRFVELELSHEGYETGKAADGRSGLDEALRGDYDLVILDIMLPELSGIEVLRRLRKESDVPVILLTARDSVTDKVTGKTRPRETERKTPTRRSSPPPRGSSSTPTPTPSPTGASRWSSPTGSSSCCGS